MITQKLNEIQDQFQSVFATIRRVGYIPELKRVLKSTNATVMLGQIIYWHLNNEQGQQRLKVIKQGYYWIAKTLEEWSTELGFTINEVKHALNVIRRTGAVVCDRFKFNREVTLHLRIDFEKFAQLFNMSAIAQRIQEQQSSKKKPPNTSSTNVLPDERSQKCHQPISDIFTNPITETTSRNLISGSEEAPTVALPERKCLQHGKVGTPHSQANGVHGGSVDVLSNGMEQSNIPDPVADPEQETRTRTDKVTNFRDSGIGASGEDIPSLEENRGTLVLNTSVPSTTVPNAINPPKIASNPCKPEPMTKATSRPKIERPRLLEDILGRVRGNGFAHIPTKGAYALQGSMTLRTMEMLVLMDCAVEDGVVEWDFSGEYPMITAPIIPSGGEYMTVDEEELIEVLPMRRLQDSVATDGGESTGTKFIFDREWYKKTADWVFSWWGEQIKEKGKGWAVDQIGKVSLIVRDWLESEGRGPAIA